MALLAGWDLRVKNRPAYSQHTLGLTGWLPADPDTNETKQLRYTWLGVLLSSGKANSKSLKNYSSIHHGDSQQETDQ